MVDVANHPNHRSGTRRTAWRIIAWGRQDAALVSRRSLDTDTDRRPTGRPGGLRRRAGVVAGAPAMGIGGGPVPDDPPRVARGQPRAARRDPHRAGVARSPDERGALGVA